MPTESKNSPFSFSFSRIKKTSALALVAAFILSGCGSENTSSINASNVLQNVGVDLNNSAEVSKVHSTVVSFDSASGASSSKEQDYALRDTVNDLPIRITTRYTTDEKSGNNLDDLEGYTGDVSIDITVENLTVSPEQLTYDVAGAQKEKTALVGAPLSVAASTTFQGVKPQKILSDATVGNGNTNGIISTNDEGDAVLQWGKILAGPSSSASTTFTVNLSAEDLKVPEFTVAVHPGLSNDLSASGAVSSSFSKTQDSELELMQQTVEIVAEANQALADAGATISDIRDNLNSTSESLKSSTVQELQQSSDKLTGQLTDLQEKLGGLKANLGESTQGSQSELIGQMQQTVESLEKFLGREGEQIPAPVMDAGTCKVDVTQPANGTSVYSNMVQLSNILGEYSKANVDCRDRVVDVMNSILGPENPTPETCKDSTSAACSVFNSQVVMTATLLESAANTNKMVEQLRPGALSQVSTDYVAAYEALQDLQKQVDALPENTETVQPVPAPTTPSESPSPSDTPSPEENPSPTPTETSTKEPSKNPEDYKDILASLDTIDGQMKTSSENLQKLEDLLKSINNTAQKALAEITKDAPGNGSMLTQNQELADQLCTLTDGGTEQAGKLSQEEVNRLRGYLTDTPCGETPTPVTPSPTPTTPNPGSPEPVKPESTPTPDVSPTPTASQSSSTPEPNDNSGTPIVIDPAADITIDTPQGYQDPMDTRLKNQADLWTSILNSTDTVSEESQTAQEIQAVRESLTGVTDETAKIRDALDREIVGGNVNPKNEDPTPQNPQPQQPVNPQPVEPQPEVSDPQTPHPVIPTPNQDVKAIKNSVPNLNGRFEDLSTSLDDLATQQQEINDALQQLMKDAPAENADEIADILNQQARNVSRQRTGGEQAITDLFSQQVTTLSGSSDSISNQADALVKDQSEKLNAAAQQQVEEADARTQSALERIQESHDQATTDAAGASTVLTSELEKIMLDVGDTSVTGSGLLGSLQNNAGNAENADYQLSLATENAQKYSTIREEDMGAIRLKQAQYDASLKKLGNLPPFHLEAPSGATVKTIYTFTIGGEK